MLALPAALACGGETVTLGMARVDEDPTELPRLPPALRFSNITRRDELSTEGKNDNPTLTEDLLHIYFTSDRDGGPGDADVWHAVRRRVDEPFDPPELVAAVSSSEYESSSAISLDGRFLWVGSERDGGQGELDIWVSERMPDGTFGEPKVLSILSSPEKDIPRPLGLGGTLMPLSSQRDSPGVYRTYFARWSGEAFAPPELIEELVFEEGGTVDAFLTEDGKTLLFTLGMGEDNGDLYMARRPSIDQPFQTPEPLADLNTSADERDPWLSPDGSRFFFASDRDGVLSIYEATVERVEEPAP